MNFEEEKETEMKNSEDLSGTVSYKTYDLIEKEMVNFVAFEEPKT